MSLIKNYKRYLNLSRILNSSFGSGGPGHARVSTQSITFKIVDEDYIKANYQTLISIGSPHMQEQQQQIFAKEGSEMIKSAVDKIKDMWKEQFPEEKVPTFEIDFRTAQDSMEFVSYSIYSPVKRAIYRLSCLVKVKY